jgi:hypothetical protein
MTLDEQLKADRKLLRRIDEFGKGLTPAEVNLIESYLRWVEHEPLTKKQREVAEAIDDRRVE